ncbi:DUF389 domain-containing protein [Rhodococcus tukisamuensis]|nr:DUF389 domain-containing protein [Rhodococcus tukisamuensis]
MLHLRVISPVSRTEDVLAMLRAQPGATHIVLTRGGALSPEGDAVQADLARECTDEVVDALESMGLEHTGAITLEPLDTVISDAARQARRLAPGDPDDTVVWEELLGRTREESTLNATFLAFLTIACLLAAIGVVTDSPVTIVGAMVVGPEFGPLAALAVAIVRRERRLARRSLLALVVGFPVAMLVTAVGALAAEAAGWLSLETFDRIHQVDFIYQVGPFSLVVALLAGSAGMLALVSSKSAALVGVFISVTTVPAAGFAVVAATVGQWHVALLSVCQLGVNMIGIVSAGVLVLALHPRRRQALRRRRGARPDRVW